jgi:hypothetical protein
VDVAQVDDGPAFRVKTKEEEEKEEQERLEHLMGSVALSGDQAPPPSRPTDAASAVTSRVLGFGGGGGAMKPLTAAEDDLKGWVNPDNYGDAAARRAEGFAMGPGACRMGADDKVQGPISVACVTTDFAMQNVLLQVRGPRAKPRQHQCRWLRGREGVRTKAPKESAPQNHDRASL